MTAPTHLAALVSPGWHAASTVGDTDPLISDAKRVLRIYSYGKAEGLGTTDVDDTYTAGFGRALVTYKAAVRTLVQKGLRKAPATDLDTEFDWATKKQMGLLAPPPPIVVPGNKMKPLGVSVEGHMSEWNFGPTIFLFQQLEQEGLIQAQGTTYSNKTLPFQSDTGVDSLVGFFLDPVLMPPGRKWLISGFSEGDIVVSRFMIRHVLNPAGMFHHRLVDMICMLEMGAPYRPLDYLGDAVLEPDPPQAGTAGISPERLPTNQIEGRLAYLVRHDDMYTEVPMDKPGELQRSVYSLVAASDPKALLFEFLAVGLNPTAELMNIVQAIMRGTMFVFNMDPHGGYDLGPATDWVRGKVRAAVTA
jgi:hypothetical protein